MKRKIAQVPAVEVGFKGSSKGRILLLMNQMRLAGSDIMTLNLALALKRREYFVAIASEPGALCSAIHGAGIPHYHLTFNSRSPFHLLKTAYELHRIVERNEFQILNPQSLMSTLLSWWIVSPMFPPGHWTSRQVRVVTTIHNVENPKHVRFAARVLLSLPDAVIFENQYERDRLIRAGLSRSIGTVIYTGVEEDPGSVPYRREALDIQIPNGAVVIGTAARLSPEKGLDFLLRAVAKVVSEFPDIYLLVIGDGPERPYLDRLADDLGIRSVIHFLGARNDVMQLLPAIDIYALTSLREALPRAIREAMICGKPIVALDVGGVSEAVQTGLNGIIVKERNVDLFAEAILQLARDRDLAQRMGAEGRRLARERFGVDRWVDDTLKVFGFYPQGI